MKLQYLALLIFITLPGYSQKKAEVSFSEQAARKEPVSFSHQPILLLKICPTAILGGDNALQFGAELAPPFGKFSFQFDYAKGQGDKWNLNKYTLQNHPEQKTTIYRGEIRLYFSDWYPFYALDKKPFGRYYAFEFVQKNIKQSQPAISLSPNAALPFPQITNINALINDKAINAKLGKHFKIARLFFVDAYAGVGLAWYKSDAEEAIDLELFSHSGFSFTTPNRTAGTKGLYLSKTAGVKLCLVL